ncbi:OCIA domain-containing protein 2 [Sphaeramia orbicularis]|uniref:OCIA domain-containing protein n=1 Tax=Sphaeramia orbicularis TaxID=375764 RepID=A0A672ZRL6_9TELE|nr:OCIA domain-containing protein 2 [Sphaeramia orbicularis]XP_029987228.1 OCIA domain-containing protein 2 [Sphaeramia orbicularis]
MSSEETEQTIVVKTEAAATGPGSAEVKGKWKCPVSDRHIHREDVKKVWKECQEESFWYRALPLSLGGMAVTGGLIYNGVWKSSKRFGPFPKLAIAGILGYMVGKASYMETCRSKFKELGIGPGPWGEGGRPGPFGPPGQMWGKRSCNHVCEECKKKSPAASAEQAQA